MTNVTNIDSAPFTYPTQTRVRRHGPDGYADYSSYRPWLRDEFSFRCIYCLERERWGRVTGQFDLDHFVPQAQSPGERPCYENLVYACHACNLRKRDLDLPENSLSAEQVRVYENGQIIGLTPEANRIIQRLYLNTPQSIEWRRLWIRTIQLAAEFDQELYYQLMRYPDDLPNLSRLNPPRNHKPEGIAQSHFARRERGELPATYLT